MVKKAKQPTLELKDAKKPFLGTLSDITKSTKISKNLRKHLGKYKLVVVKFMYSGFKTHVFLRDACTELGIPCTLSPDSCPSYRLHHARTAALLACSLDPYAYRI